MIYSYSPKTGQKFRYPYLIKDGTVKLLSACNAPAQWTRGYEPPCYDGTDKTGSLVCEYRSEFSNTLPGISRPSTTGVITVINDGCLVLVNGNALILTTTDRGTGKSLINSASYDLRDPKMKRKDIYLANSNPYASGNPGGFRIDGPFYDSKYTVGIVEVHVRCKMVVRCKNATPVNMAIALAASNSPTCPDINLGGGASDLFGHGYIHSYDSEWYETGILTADKTVRKMFSDTSGYDYYLLANTYSGRVRCSQRPSYMWISNPMVFLNTAPPSLCDILCYTTALYDPMYR